jgi:Zn-dependent protease with chaperone function
MGLAVYLPLVVPVLAAVMARMLAERLPPRTATWLLTGSAAALATASSAVLGLLAIAAAVRIPLVAAVGDLSLPALSQADRASMPLGLAAGALLAAAAAAAVRAGWRRTGALVAAHRQASWLPGAGQVVVVTDDAADAYAAPGWPGRIVVTTGMMDALTAAERQVLLAHERAHASGRHYLFTAAARLASAANPLLRPLAAAVGYSVERWADEEAATATGDRPLVARAVAAAALAAAAGPSPAAAPAGALGAVATPAGLRGAGAVPRRVAALLGPPPRLSLLLLAAAIALVAVSGLSALEAARNLHGLIEFAQAGGLP